MKRLSSFSHRAVAHAFEAIVLATAAGACAYAVAACGGATSSGTGTSGNGDNGGSGGITPDGGIVTGDGGTGTLSYDGFTKLVTPATCAAPLKLLGGIHPADVDSAIEQRHVTVSDTFISDADAADGGATDPSGCREGVTSDTVLDTYGTECAHATDPTSCKAHAACEVPPGAGWLTFQCSGPCFQTKEGTFYLEINGDAISFPVDLKTMLGVIDTPSEAVLIANKAGYDTPTSCTEPYPGAYRVVGDAYELLVQRQQSCGDGRTQLRIRVNADGSIVELERAVLRPDTMTACAAGRRPVGFDVTEPGGAARSIVDYLVELASLEAASIAEFATLRDELRAHGAPEALVAAAERARRDEIQHARVTQRLARSFGGRPARVSVAPQGMRSLEQLATHNAVEGCVRETFGALSATWQARHASHPEIARAFAQIADDETRHAAFSWELAAWLETKLDAAARARVAVARAEAFEELRLGQDVAPAREVAMLAGAPEVAVAQRLVAQMAKMFELDAAHAVAA
jgi:hypothetical protein